MGTTIDNISHLWIHT